MYDLYLVVFLDAAFASSVAVSFVNLAGHLNEQWSNTALAASLCKVITHQHCVIGLLCCYLSLPQLLDIVNLDK